MLSQSFSVLFERKRGNKHVLAEKKNEIKTLLICLSWCYGTCVLRQFVSARFLFFVRFVLSFATS